ncbi:hypothetical protein [Halopiger goleimassiliensis]|uniref:hypothetical protein n=1 Tax=Halopiger goleimassiliensis TaxID=1293048 RepID=UPI0006775CCD|nr:hypothetical protein [Halopiger goleimassiliensis]
MHQLGWLLATVYTGVAVGLVYSLAIRALEVFVLLSVLLLVFAIPQWLVLSRANRSTDRATSRDG